jgi:hypothetical protein
LGKNQTVPQQLRCALGALAILAGCGSGEEPDPNAIRAQLMREHRLVPSDDAAPLMVATMLPLAPPPAPMAESARVDQRGAPSGVAAVVLGQNAKSVVDRALFAGFTTACGGEVLTEPVVCSDRDAVELMLVGRADFAVIGGQLTQRDVQAGLRQVQLGVELFALAVPVSSPLRSLSHQQVRQIFTGAVTHWQQLGVHGGAIVAVVPSDHALADRAARALIPGDQFGSTCLGVASDRHVRDQLLREPGAIGIVRVHDAPVDGEQKLLQIDWSPPTLAAFGYGTYPFGVPCHLVTSGQPTGIARRFQEFVGSDAGRAHLGRWLLLP